MKVKDIMTKKPVCVEGTTPLQEVARLMVEHNCGALPVMSAGKLGIITDRDMVCRLLAKGKNLLELTADACLTDSVVTVQMDADVEDAISLMKEHQIRRLVVVDADDKCAGILAQADIALGTSDKTAGDLVEKVSSKA